MTETNASCLNLPYKQNTELYTCEYCNYNTKRKYNLKRHISICKKKKYDKNKVRELEDKLLESKTEVKILKENNFMLQNIISESKTINNIYSNISNDKRERIRDIETRVDIKSACSENYPEIPAIYLIGDPLDICCRLTYGRTNNFKRRAHDYRLYFKCVDPVVHYYIHMEEKETRDIESILHKVFHNYRDPKNSEWLTGISVDNSICKITSAIELYRGARLQPWNKVPEKYKSIIYSIMINKKQLQSISDKTEQNECKSVIVSLEQTLPETILDILHTSPFYTIFTTNTENIDTIKTKNLMKPTKLTEEILVVPTYEKPV